MEKENPDRRERFIVEQERKLSDARMTYFVAASFALAFAFLGQLAFVALFGCLLLVAHGSILFYGHQLECLRSQRLILDQAAI